jgi:tetratricopeptide (TPR) repeat protein
MFITSSYAVGPSVAGGSMRTNAVSSALRGGAVLSLLLILAACGSAESRKSHYLERGRSYLEQGNLDKARVEVRNALQISPNDAEARYQNGVVSERLGNASQAAQFYRSALESDAGHVSARTRLARLYVLAASPDEALAALEPGLKSHPDDPGFLTVKASALSRRDPTGALPIAQEAYARAPTDPDTIAVLAGIQNANGHAEVAQQVLERGVRDLPRNVDLRLALAQQYESHEQTAAAEAVLKALVNLEPAQPQHALRLVNYYNQHGRASDAEAALRAATERHPGDDRLELALVEQLARASGEPAARAELARVITARPKAYGLRSVLALREEAAGERTEAIRDYESLIRDGARTPVAAGAKVSLAALRARGGENAEARRLVNEVIAENARDGGALALRAELEVAAGDPKSAIVDLRAVLRDEPNAAPLLRALARAHLRNREVDLAEEALRRAATENPDDRGARFDLTELLLDRGKSDQARPLAQQLLALEPANVFYIKIAMRAVLAAKDYAGAGELARKVAETRPDLGEYLLGGVAEAQGDLEQARGHYEKSCALAPRAREPLETLVTLLLRQGKSDAALAQVAKALAADANNTIARSLQGDAYRAAKRWPDAGKAYQTAIDAASDWWPPYHGLALIQEAQHDTDAAIATLKLAQSRVREPELVTIELASLYEQGNRHDAAIATYEDALKRNPHFEIAANNLAMLLVSYRGDAGSLARAESLVRELGESENVDFLDTVAWVRYKRAEYSQALPILERVVKLAPESANFRYHLGMTELKAGKREAARADLERAISSKRSFDGVGEAKATLATLLGG